MAQRLKTDWILFLTVLGLVLFGLVMVYSSSSMLAQLRYHLSSTYFFFRQLGLGGRVRIPAAVHHEARLPALERGEVCVRGPWASCCCCCSRRSSRIPASHRWLKSGPLSLQPSELAKPALALFLAFFLSRRLGAINNKHTLLPIAVCYRRHRVDRSGR